MDKNTSKDNSVVADLHSKKFQLNIKPTATRSCMYDALAQLFDASNKNSIEVYEEQLSKLSKEYIEEIKFFDIRETIRAYHILELKNKTHKLTDQNNDLLNMANRKFVMENPDIFDHYKFLQKCLKFLSNLAIKWKLTNIRSILYRIENRATILPVIDMKQLKKEYFSPQILSIAVHVSEFPLCKLVSDDCKLVAELLIDQLNTVISTIFTRNKGAISESVETPAEPNRKLVSTDKSDLKLPGLLKRLLFKSKVDQSIMEKYEDLRNFEMVYRTFEKDIMDFFIKINNYKYSEFNNFRDRGSAKYTESTGNNFFSYI